MGSASGVDIRLLEPGDVDLFRDLLRCFADAFAEPETYLSRQPDDGYLRDLLGDAGFVAVVAVHDGAVVGGLAGYLLRKFEQPRSELYIYDLAVREAHRRRGIATALINEARRVARDQGAWVVFVQADGDDEPAIALYSGLGIKEDVAHFDIPME